MHLVAFIRANRAFLFKHPQLKTIPACLKHQLRTISHATVDRLLAPTRKRLISYRSGQRNPHAAWLKKAIPVQSYAQKPTAAFGYLEIDSVFHAGTTTGSQFAATLDVTEIETGWTELELLPNLAQVWTEQALKRIIRRLPFCSQGLHSDNGHEFINRRLTLLARKLKLPHAPFPDLPQERCPFCRKQENATLVRPMSVVVATILQPRSES